MLDHSGHITESLEITAMFTIDNNQLTDEELSLCDVICRGDDVTGVRCFTATGEGGADGAVLQPYQYELLPL